MMKVAVVILNFNGKELLQKFLPSVVRFSPSAKIILADNHSADGSVEMVRKEFPLIEIISIPENRGFCGGYNYALQKIEAEYYVLLNSDVEVTAGWIEPIIELFEKDTTIGAVQPKILSYHRKDQFEYAGAGGGFIDTLSYPFCWEEYLMHWRKIKDNSMIHFPSFGLQEPASLSGLRFFTTQEG